MEKLLKLRADVEIIKKDFNEKENKQLSHYDKLVKFLEEKNEKLTQDVQTKMNKKKMIIYFPTIIILKKEINNANHNSNKTFANR
ncbi:hypothetical protein RFI_29872 [Reticulomyxa filosa]|uniref:Uncharacterized protein n=1 Tax=Reticulomyxa filosa TaxID=46433 RepID=X6M0X7_RETFI|nr:hypothetical protein RFI_29872 [Reticulomyxa filosa]|eukprot:ETO07519.1 hypothetical protein RFI_29872 [Reticulomyxa filosa]